MKLSFLLINMILFALVTSHSHAQDPYAVMNESCLKELKLTQSGCDCVIEKAKAELDEKELTFLVAAVSNNPQAMVQAQSQLSGDQMMTVTNFMTATPSLCQNQ